MVFAASYLDSKVHVFGDSHSFSFSEIPNFEIHWLGPVTMHRIGRDGKSFLNVKNFGVNENDTCIFVFGEIDVRAHIFKQKNLGREVPEIIEDLSRRYVDVIESIRQDFFSLNCIIYNVTPPCDFHENPSFPRVGSLHDRVQATLQLNKSIQQKCILKSIQFIDLYEILSDREGILRYEISDQTVHVSAPAFRTIFMKYNRNTNSQRFNLFYRHYNLMQ